jgi:hypothetical protein
MQIDFKGNGKGKGKFFPVHTVKAYRGSGGVLPPFLNCGLYGLATLAAGRSIQFLFNRRLDMPQSWFGHFGEEINLLPLLLFKPKIIQSVS